YSEKDTSNVIRQVLEAVAYLHSLKIVHRNLKLENLVYYNRLKNSKIVISDFHLAKLENGLIKEPCGTPEYLAPEVVGRQRYGRPVDCWAIGVIMYILLSGNPPFYEEADEDDYENHDKNLFRKILAGDYEFDPPYWDDISQAAKELVTRLMEVEQDQRITAEEPGGLDKLRQHQRRLPSLSVGPGACRACRQHGTEQDAAGWNRQRCPGSEGSGTREACRRQGAREGSQVPRRGSAGHGRAGTPGEPRPLPQTPPHLPRPRRPRPPHAAPPSAPARDP
uniref:CaM kinase like vesicle associated n=1 Tax=Serinus canaria TaxID=9135 RepID=A0A8C9KTU0_SERCA